MRSCGAIFIGGEERRSFLGYSPKVPSRGEAPAVEWRRSDIGSTSKLRLRRRFVPGAGAAAMRCAAPSPPQHHPSPNPLRPSGLTLKLPSSLALGPINLHRKSFIILFTHRKNDQFKVVDSRPARSAGRVKKNLLQNHWKFLCMLRRIYTIMQGH